MHNNIVRVIYLLCACRIELNGKLRNLRESHFSFSLCKLGQVMAYEDEVRHADTPSYGNIRFQSPSSFSAHLILFLCIHTFVFGTRPNSLQEMMVTMVCESKIDPITNTSPGRKHVWMMVKSTPNNGNP